jgi:hypothetical protein
MAHNADEKEKLYHSCKTMKLFLAVHCWEKQTINK